jgi:uncharacterized protein (UPF0335 family)
MSESHDELRALVERIESIEGERASLAEDVRALYAEAASKGFDKKALRAVVKYRKEDADKRAEFDAVVESYMAALGSLATTPLGRSAMHRAGLSASA